MLGRDPSKEKDLFLAFTGLSESTLNALSALTRAMEKHGVPREAIIAELSAEPPTLVTWQSKSLDVRGRLLRMLEKK